MSDIKNNDQDLLNKAVKDGGSFGIIRQRLNEDGSELKDKVESLNKKRQDEFGSSKNEIIGKIIARTENRCSPVDMAQVKGFLLLGYNVFVGMKASVSISDVFSLYKINEEDNDFSAEPINISTTKFLSDPEFLKSFNQLFTYYKDAHLVQVTTTSNYLLASFRTGSDVSDVRVFRWNINNDGTLSYMDDKGQHDIKSPLPHNFEWIETTRENQVSGKHPHISILDKVFVETINGNLTIKIENNTENGQGIYSEPVQDQNQGLEDAKISYAEIGSLILLKILPYREDETRYLIYNEITESVKRVDTIGNSCVELPESHGIVFPNGYYLENGDNKLFDEESENLTYHKTISSPNGEDFMYIFFDKHDGFYSIYSYNIIQKSLSNPIHAHGFSLYNNGQMVIFRSSENTEATKVHPMRIWQTPFFSDDFFSQKEINSKQTFFTKIGNSELVRSVSDLYTVCHYISKKDVTTSVYEGLIKTATKLLDDYHWLKNNEIGDISSSLIKIIDTSELVIEEFEKVKSIQKQAESILSDAEKLQKEIISSSKLTSKYEIAPNVQALAKVKSHLGHLISIKVQRYIDLERINELEVEINNIKNEINGVLLNVLQDDNSFKEYFTRISTIEESLVSTTKVVDIDPLEMSFNEVNSEIDLINSEVNEIDVKDATVITKILDTVSEVFSKLNQLKSKIRNKKKGFLSTEAKAEFASQFKLLSQSVSSSISKAESPAKCDEEMARLMSQIEALESKFADFDEYLEDIYTKREEISSIFESHKQQLLSEIQKRTINIENVATLTLKNIEKNAEKFDDIDKLNGYFASDNMVLKIHKFVKSVSDLGDSVRADNIESRLKKIKDQSLRSLRDNKDIFEDGGKIMKMGKHRFSVNKNDVDLTILPINGELTSHLTATDFYERLDNKELSDLKHVWDLDVISETKDIYRGEYLAYSVLNAAENGQNNLSLDLLNEAAKEENGLLKIIQTFSSTIYKEGYVKGIHDHDAEKILLSVLKIYGHAGLLKYSQRSRAYAILASELLLKMTTKFDYKSYKQAKTLAEQLNNYSHLKETYNSYASLISNELGLSGIDALESAEYYCELMLENENNDHGKTNVDVTTDGFTLYNEFSDFKTKLNLDLSGEFTLDNYNKTRDWINSFVNSKDNKEWTFFIDEATVISLLNFNKDYQVSEKGLKLTSKIQGLLGDHNLIENEELLLTLDDFISRAKHQMEVIAPAYNRYIELRHNITNEQREFLQLENFKAKPLASFVRNRLITDSYLHLIGDNFAKQMGTVGDSKRSDLMGMLLLISPPGYGKTTLIEYVASKLGLVFMKINCPSLNHEVVSLDPAEAPDATAAKELEKLNLGLEMGNNVLLYLDDIQHTSPEFLQKFISLCDGTRKIDGVWRGKPKTYDMKGKKFAVCMAGNPYTESGEAFKIPDMLANRADIYNLGDMLSGQESVFELSYIENSLTSNSVLAPLANRNLDDLYKIIDMAKGIDTPINELEHNYSPAEVNEIKNVIQKLLKIQKVVLKVNQQYITSASVEDKYREEPSFRLQGSYRNMNKMTEKVVSVMNDDEIQNLILDHYRGESQTLTVGTEDNYLKLKSMIGCMTEKEEDRWNSILSDFKRHKSVGDADTDGTVKIANQLSIIQESFTEYLSNNSNSDNRDLESISEIMKKFTPNEDKDNEIIKLLHNMNKFVSRKNKVKEEKDNI